MTTLEQAADHLASLAPRASSEGTLVGHLAELIDALSEQDWVRAVRAVRDLLDDVVGDSGAPPGASFQAGSALKAIDWRGLIKIVVRILPLLIDAAGSSESAPQQSPQSQPAKPPVPKLSKTAKKDGDGSEG